MSIIFTHDQEQHETALSSKKDHEELSGSKVYTEIKPFEHFYLAEDYHQKYYLQGDQVLFREIQAYYKIFSELVGSTVAARLNGYVAGYGESFIFQEEHNDYGLSQAAIARLQSYLE
jgi:peptide-methionine (S)-S-oxide reductase